MFEEQKAGLQGQGTISEESGSSREDGRVGQGPNYVSLSRRGRDSLGLAQRPQAVEK